MKRPLKIAMLITDARRPGGLYDGPMPSLGTAPDALLQGFAGMPDVEIHVVSCVQQPVRSPEKIAPNIFYHSLPVPKTGWLRTLYQGCIRATRKKLRELQPDVVHAQGTERDCAISAVFSGFPNVLTIHGNMRAIAPIFQARFGDYYWLTAKLEAFTLPRAGGVFCNSAYTENLVAPLARKTWRVPNALRAEFFQPRPQKNSAGVPALLNIGVLQPRKQQLELLALARNLHRRGLKFELQFAGDLAPKTEYAVAFNRELARAAAAGYARNLGLLSAPQLIAALDAAAALIHFPTEEAFGLVAAEALARNLKFFGSAVGGVNEIAGGVDGAELFPPAGFMALENAIARWLAAGSPAPRAAAKIMRQRYHPEVVARRHLEIYREISGPLRPAK
ncbi:MAG TPA: glycosyltransferase family 4 protein [Verrucomicrobiae bacterium]|jgi:glycosyltransferase involved in cell wall biosynthesis